MEWSLTRTEAEQRNCHMAQGLAKKRIGFPPGREREQYRVKRSLMMRTTVTTVLVLALFAGAANAAMFSTNFYAYGKGGATYWDQESWRETVRVDATDADPSAGVWETTAWENREGSSGTLTSDDGDTATFTLNNYRNGSPHFWTSTRDTSNDVDSGNASMLDAKLNGTEYDAANGTGIAFPGRIVDFTVSSIPYDMYDVIVYLAVNDGQKYSGLGTIRANEQIPADPTDQTGGMSFTMLETLNGAKYEPDGTLDRITEDGDSGNYVLYQNLTGDFHAQIWGDDFTHLGLAGLQIQEVPEPATLALLAVGGLAIIRRRRS